MGAPTLTENPLSPSLDHDISTQNNHDVSSESSSNALSTLEATYTSLIQQYLQVWCLDNALFLAERMVAACHRSTNSLYWLATCHARRNAPRRAVCILDQVDAHTPDTLYLLAKCCYDLKEYDRAEQALLQHARTQYGTTVSSSNNEPSAPPQSMEDWMLDTTPCPVPNGAAGLYLLGQVMRQSNRKQRAMVYYKMSLQLDPLMWSSYEALCELGATDIDPTSVFGVRPIQLEEFHTSSNGMNTSPRNRPLQEQSVLGSSFLAQHPQQQAQGQNHQGRYSENHHHHSSIQAGASTPLETARFQAMELGTPAANTMTRNRSSSLSTAPPPRRNLQFETPNLTPIPHNQDASFVSHHGGQPEPGFSAQGSASNGSAGLFMESHNPWTIRRAKQVAARLYYPPSPAETPTSLNNNHHNMSTIMNPPSSSYLMGRNVQLFQADASSIQQDDVEATPLRRNSLSQQQQQQPVSSFLQTAASTARKPRNLFASHTHNTHDDVDLTPAPTTTSALDDMNGENDAPQTQTQMQQQENNLDEKPKPVVTTEPLEMILAADNNNTEAVQDILELLCLVGAAYWRLCQYQCREALQLFHGLPQVHRNTGWVLHQEGRAHLEMADYQSAQRSLEMMQRLEPYRMKGLELLSTVLWQLKKEIDLAHLAQTAVDFDRQSAEAWCVVGNCFSLQKEHETALVFFGRSLQLDPTFTYVHTLSGYEYMANEDFEKAIGCFRSAIRADERHYNAWYGLGAIYHRQEKYDLAEYHFHRAVTINPQSSVLRCNLGMSQFANGKSFQALSTLEEAFRLDPFNPQARFQRATVYISMNRYEDALAELEKVRDAAPREATIHFTMGKVLKKLGRPEQAMRCFLTALDLDPSKDSQLIKSAMDKLDEPDVEDEAAGF